MKIRILSSAYNDLMAGREFYENRSEGLGDYFFDSLFSDIDSLLLHGGIHLKVFGYTGYFLNAFLLQFIIKLKKQKT